ncbi:MAG: glycosyltransferase [Planctomycetes bacterium]|nr:glycosyltransferase [Planctomycetota bacterium]
MITSVTELFLASVVITSMLYYFFSLFCTMHFFRKKLPGGDYLPPVTVLKPLNGLENGIYENLLSHLNQDYPSFQMVFGVHHDDDPVIPTVKRLMGEFPEKKIELVVSREVVGPNMKVCNLNNMYFRAENDVIVINDSDTRVGPDYLRRIVSELEDPDVGAATCVYKVRNSSGFGAAIGAFFVNCDFLPSALVAYALGMSFGFGVTIAIKRRALEEIDAFHSLADYIAEDYQMGQRLVSAGYKLRVSNYVVLTEMQKSGFWDQVWHLLRWVSTIRVCRPKGYFFRIFTMGMPFSVLLLIVSNFSGFAITVFFSHMFARYLTAIVIDVKYLEETGDRSLLFFLPMFDLVIFVVWCCGLFMNKVTWGGHTFLLHEGGSVTRQ